MPAIFICPRGHQWEDLFGDGDSSLGTGSICPVCGAVCAPPARPERTEEKPGPEALPATMIETDPQPIEPARTVPYPQANLLLAPASAGVAVPGYEILGELGRGGMGVVYKARHEKLQRIVALKMVLAGGHLGAVGKARFRAEAEAVARLQHPNIVQIYEIGEHDGLPYFSLEFVDAGSLAQQVAGTPQSPRQAAQLVETLARAVHAAHLRGILHRDLKPSNVLLSTENLVPGTGPSELLSTFVPKIADFGLAKRLGEDSGQTRTGEVVGTPSYMAPEQATGRIHDLSPATDVYALGAILYELATGRPPFRAETPMDTLLQVAFEEPVPIFRLRPQLPADLRTICLKCLEKEPRKRYASAEALADDLKRFLAGEPILARPVGNLERLFKWARRRPAAAALVLVSGLAMLTVLIGSLWFNFRLQQAYAVEQQRAREAEELQALAQTERDRADTERSIALEQQSLAEQQRRQAERQRTFAQEQERQAKSNQREAEVQRDRADQNRRRAEANFRKAREAVDQIVRAVGQEGLADVPLMEQVRRQLLEEALRFRQGFLAERSTDPAVRQETGQAYQQVGDLYQMLGKHAKARESYAQAIALFEKLGAEFPEQSDYRQDLAESFSHLGQLLRETGDPLESERVYGKALDLQSRLAAAPGSEPSRRQQLARIYNSLALLLRNTSRSKEAETAYRRALDLQQQLLKDRPEDPTVWEDLAGSQNDLGNVLRSQGRQVQAEAAYREALPLFKKLATTFPTNATFRHKLAALHNNLGLLLREAHKPKDAEEALREALAYNEALVNDFPAVPGYRQELANSHNTLAAILSQTGKPAEAEQAYRQALALQEKLVADYRTVPDYQSALGGTLDNLAALLRDRGRLVDARARLEQALGYHEAALRANARHPTYKRFLRNHFAVLAETLLKQGDHRQAAQAAAELPRILPESWEAYYRAAAVLARCLALVEKDAQVNAEERPVLARAYAEKAVQILHESIKQGYRNKPPLKTAEVFAPLRERDDFKKLIAEVEGKAKASEK